jgi:hypothetical protein
VKLPPFLDLRKYSRNADTMLTLVSFTRASGRGGTWPWLLFGEAHIRNLPESQTSRRELSAYVNGGVTDFEHDSAKLLVLPLIGLTFGSLPVRYHVVELYGWVDPELDEHSDHHRFRVPWEGYDPMEGAERCELRATDNLAPDTVRAWASSARCRGVNLKKVKDALQVADEMEAWAKKHGGASEPD